MQAKHQLNTHTHTHTQFLFGDKNRKNAKKRQKQEASDGINSIGNTLCIQLLMIIDACLVTRQELQKLRKNTPSATHTHTHTHTHTQSWEFKKKRAPCMVDNHCTTGMLPIILCFLTIFIYMSLEG
jgi:hypothetical protein